MSIKALIELHKNYAKLLLEDDEIGEFYPFAHGVTESDNVIAVMQAIDEVEDEFPSITSVHEQLKKELAISNLNNKFKIVSITTDVKYTPYGSDTITNAIQIAFSFKNGIAINYYAPYKIVNNIVHYGRIEWSEISNNTIVFETIDIKESVLTLSRILENNSPVLSVIHDDIHQWKMTDGKPFDNEDTVLTDLKHMLKITPSLIEVLDLELNYEARRSNISSEWERNQSK